MPKEEIEEYKLSSRNERQKPQSEADLLRQILTELRWIHGLLVFIFLLIIFRWIFTS